MKNILNELGNILKWVNLVDVTVPEIKGFKNKLKNKKELKRFIKLARYILTRGKLNKIKSVIGGDLKIKENNENPITTDEIIKLHNLLKVLSIKDFYKILAKYPDFEKIIRMFNKDKSRLLLNIEACLELNPDISTERFMENYFKYLKQMDKELLDFKFKDFSFKIKNGNICMTGQIVIERKPEDMLEFSDFLKTKKFIIDLLTEPKLINKIKDDIKITRIEE